MEDVMAGVVVAVVGGALFRWLRHKAWRISLFAIAFVALAHKLSRTMQHDQEGLWIGMLLFLLLSFAGAFLIGLMLRSRAARAVRGGVILLSKNVDALADVARQHDDASNRK